MAIANHYVSTTEELQSALTEAQNNGLDDVIHIAQGTYLGNFVYVSSEEYDLSILGGYSANFSVRDTDAVNTILDGNSTDRVLALSTSINVSNIDIDRITIHNGVESNPGSGLRIDITGSLNLTNNIISNNETSSTCVYINVGSLQSVMFDNNTITNNYGGVEIQSSDNYGNRNGLDLVFTNNTVDNNLNNLSGSIATVNIKDGISNTTFDGNVFNNNNYIGNIDADTIRISGTGSHTIVNNNINDNVSYGDGGISILNGSSAELTNNTIVTGGISIVKITDEISLTNNSITDGGISIDGKVYGSNFYTYTDIVNLSYNEVSNGSGISISNTDDALIVNNIIKDNISTLSGGGVYLYSNENVVVANNIITNNTAVYGGGVYVSGTDTLELTNNIILNNNASDGGGIYASLTDDQESLVLANNIIYSNSSSQKGEDIYLNNDRNDNYIPSTVLLVNNDFDQSADGIYIKRPFTIDESNLDNISPLFIDADNGDYRLSSNSPLIDQGDAEKNSTGFDLDGNPRVYYTNIDIGPYEFQSTSTIGDKSKYLDTDGSTPSSVLYGSNDNDNLIITPAIKSVNAGKGLDTAILNGNYSDFILTQSESFSVLISSNDLSQSVLLDSVEKLQFDDNLYSIDTLSTGVFQGGIDVIALSNGGFASFWVVEGLGIYAQQYDSNGRKFKGEFQVNTYTYKESSSFSNINGIALSDGRFVIAWSSTGKDGDGWGIFSQMYDIDGTSLRSETQVNTHTGSSQRFADVQAIDDGGFLIAWSSDLQDGSGSGIYAQRYADNGEPVGGEFQVNTYTNSGQTNPNIASLKDGGFIVAWDSYGQDGSRNGIFAQRYADNGEPVGGEFQVNTYTSEYQGEPKVVSLDNGGFIVAWYGDGPGDGVNTSFGFYAKIYSSDGNIYTPEFAIPGYFVDSSFDIASSGEEFIVSYASYRDGVGRNIYVQRYGLNGEKIGDEIKVSNSNSAFNKNDISVLNNGSFIVSWNEYHNSESVFFSQRYDSEGNPLGTVTLKAIIIGATGDDILQGTTGIDNISTLEGADVVYALAGNDTITLTADAVWDAGYSARNVSNDSSTGTGEKITLNGLNRFTDVIDGGADIDTINLTDGNDAFFIDDVYSGHHSSLTLSSTAQGVNSTARIVELETINAGEGNDIVDLTSTNFVLATSVTINGEAGNDNLWGSNGSDIIDGGTGDDSIFGGTGSDTLTGGTGADAFQFTATAMMDGSGASLMLDFYANLDIPLRNNQTIDYANETITEVATDDNGVIWTQVFEFEIQSNTGSAIETDTITNTDGFSSKIIATAKDYTGSMADLLNQNTVFDEGNFTGIVSGDFGDFNFVVSGDKDIFGNDVITDFGVGGDTIQLYYRAEDNHTNADLSLANGILTWDVDSTSNDVVIDLSATINSSDLNDLDTLITFVEIV